MSSANSSKRVTIDANVRSARLYRDGSENLQHWKDVERSMWARTLVTHLLKSCYGIDKWMDALESCGWLDDHVDSADCRTCEDVALLMYNGCATYSHSSYFPFDWTDDIVIA